MATDPSDQGVSFFDLAHTVDVGHLDIGRVSSLIFDPATGDLLTFGLLGLHRWPVRSDGELNDVIRVGPPQRLIGALSTDTDLDISSDGKLVAIAQYRMALVLSSDPSAKPIGIQPLQDCRHLVVSPNGRWVATGQHGDGPATSPVEVWDTHSGQRVRDLPLNNWSHARFSPDGEWLFAKNFEKSGFWRVGTWEEGASAPKGAYHDGPAFDPAGRLVTYERGDGAQLLVESPSGRRLAALENPDQGRCDFSTFTPDGTHLITSNRDSPAIHVWNVRAIRKHLKEMDLDWEAPSYPLETEQARSEPLRVRVDLGFLEDEAILGSQPTKQHLQTVVGVNALAVAFQPFNFKAYRQRGRAYGALKEYRLAVADYSIALALLPADDPNRIDLLSRRAGNYLHLREYDKAMADIREAERIDPVQGASIRRPLVGNLNRRSQAEWQSNPAAALQDLRGAVAIDPENTIAQNNLAWMLVMGPKELRDPKEALPHARTATASTEGQVFLNTLGVVLYRNGKFTEAIPVMERSLSVGKGQSDAYDLFPLAMCHAKLGDPAKAKDCFDRAVKWMEGRKDLPAQYVEELKAFRAEAEEVLKR